MVSPLETLASPTRRSTLPQPLLSSDTMYRLCQAFFLAQVHQIILKLWENYRENLKNQAVQNYKKHIQVELNKQIEKGMDEIAHNRRYLA